MASFVLLPGAWLVGAVFQPVIDRLASLGHSSLAVTYPGLADDAGVEPDLETWIQAGVEAVQSAGAGAVLVGHSFSGLVAGAVAAREPDLVGRLVYLDANLPTSGQSFADSWSDVGRQWLSDRIATSANGRWPPDLDQRETGLDDEQSARLMSHAYPTPSGPLFQKVMFDDQVAREILTTYVFCIRARTELPTEVADLVERSGWDLRNLDAGHWPMVSHPDDTAELLHDIAAGDAIE